ncbi:MAG: 4-hydroxy-tetrahydrodipicolinate synthase [Patescibacteria group bacterium]
MLQFGRVLTAMVTPFDRDLQVDLAQAGALAQRLVESGSDGVVVAGTTGESPTLTREEKLALFRVVVEAVGGKAAVVAGTGSNSTMESIELTREAEKTGVDGILLVAPYYNRPPQDGLYQHFSAVAKSTRLPVMLYNIPSRTAVNLAPDTLGRLAQIDNIVAVKESSGNPAQTVEYREKTSRQFGIYSGDDAMTLALMAVGAVGVVSVASHLVGRRIKELVEYAGAGKFEQAARINQELAPLFRALFANTNPIMVKAALNILGFKVGGLRPPLVEATEKEQELMRGCMRQVGLL